MKSDGVIRSRRELVMTMGVGGALLFARSRLPSVSRADEAVDPRVAKIVDESISIDIHNHTIWPFAKTPADVTPEPEIDLAGEIRMSGLTAVCSAYCVDIHRPAQPGEYYQYHLQSLAHMDALLAKSGMRRALSLADLERAQKAKEPIIVQVSEGAHFVEGHLDRIGEAYQRGLRHLQLLHQVHDLAAPMGDIQDNDPTRFDGLTAFGADAIKECNRLGIVVDMAHARLETIEDVLEVSQMPFIVSHSALDSDIARESLEGWLVPRLLSPDYAKAVAQSGGVVGVWRIVPTLEKYVEALKQMADVVGVDHTAIGTDTSIAPYPADPKLPLTNRLWPDQDGGFLYALVGEMLRQGFQDDEIRKIVGGNYVRIFGQVTERRA